MRIASPHKCAKVDLHAAQKAMPRGPGGGASLAYFAVRERGHAAAEDGSRPWACDSGWERRRRRCGRRRRQMQAARAVRPGSCRRVTRELGGGRRLMREAPAGRRPSGRVRSVLVVDHVGHCRRAAPPSPHYQPADCASGRGFGASSSQFPPSPARTAADRAARLPHTVRVVLSSTIYLSPCTYAPIQGPRLGLPRALCPISLPFSSIACCRGPFSLLYCFLSSHTCSSLRLPL